MSRMKDRRSFDMTEIIQHNIIDVGGGDGRGGEEVVGAQSSTPAVAAGFAADAESEGVGWRSGKW